MGYLDNVGLTHLWDKIKTALKGKQNVLSSGDGITIQNDAVSVTTPVKGIKQAEYDALSTDEKNSGLYIITDAGINLNASGDVYSTEETRIGTWINGKPLYRMVIEGISPPTTGENKVLYPPQPTWRLTRYHAFVGNDDFIQSLPSVGVEGDVSGRYIYIHWNYAMGLLCRTNFSNWANMPIWVIVEYTKTTD